MLATLDTDSLRLRRIEQQMHAMPPVRALALRVTGYDDHTLQLAAPLAPNVNDKGSAFGGSLASLLTLASWALATLKLHEAGLDGEVYVQDSQLRYLKPLYDELRVEACAAPEQDWATFAATFATRGRARVLLTAQACDAQGQVVTRFEGRFVALRAPG